MGITKPTIVIIHGAFHVPAHYDTLTYYLRAAGYEVHIPRLPSANEARPPNADLATDTQLIRTYVESLVEAGRTVIALMHSYGGQVGTNALRELGRQSRRKSIPGAVGGVSHLIYMAAYALSKGFSMMDKLNLFDDIISWSIDMADDNTAVVRHPAMISARNPEAMTREDKEYGNMLVRWSSKCMYQPLEHCAWKEIPVTYIRTKTDSLIPPPYQDSMVETMRKEGAQVQVFELETGHVPHESAPDEVVDIVNKVIAYAA
jgi:pimeloyl-ACP methyl ester carboxylesterase